MANAARPCWVTARPRSASGIALSQFVASPSRSGGPIKRSTSPARTGSWRTRSRNRRPWRETPRTATPVCRLSSDGAGRAAVEARVAGDDDLEEGEVAAAVLLDAAASGEIQLQRRRQAHRSPPPGRRRQERHAPGFLPAVRLPGRRRPSRISPSTATPASSAASSRSPTLRPIAGDFAGTTSSAT